MKKREAFNKYNELDTRVNRGADILSIFKKYSGIDLQLLGAESAFYKILLWNVPSWMIVGAVITKNWIMILVRYLLGKYDEKKLGLWKAQNEYQQTAEHISPAFHKILKELEEIKNKL